MHFLPSDATALSYIKHCIFCVTEWTRKVPVLAFSRYDRIINESKYQVKPNFIGFLSRLFEPIPDGLPQVPAPADDLPASSVLLLHVHHHLQQPLPLQVPQDTHRPQHCRHRGQQEESKEVQLCSSQGTGCNVKSLKFSS